MTADQNAGGWPPPATDTDRLMEDVCFGPIFFFPVVLRTQIISTFLDLIDTDRCSVSVSSLMTVTPNFIDRLQEPKVCFSHSSVVQQVLHTGARTSSQDYHHVY